MDELIVLTKQLKSTLEDLIVIFNNEEQPRKDKHFFAYIQSETKDIFDQLDMWEELAINEANAGNIRLREEQIVTTRDNITALVFHSYYKDVRKRRYMEINKSCHFILQQILKEIPK